MGGPASAGERQAALAELGRRAIASAHIGVVMQEAAALVASALDVECASVMELTPEGGEVRLRAAVGWAEGELGRRVDTMPGGYIAYTLASSDPVVVRELASEARFVPSTVLLEGGIRASAAVCIPGPGHAPFGVLGVHTTRERAFIADEIDFLRGVANVLASRILRHRRAIEINDDILQTLVLARYAVEGRRPEQAQRLLDEAIARTRAIVSQLLGDDSDRAATLPGDLRRTGAARDGSA